MIIAICIIVYLVVGAITAPLLIHSIDGSSGLVDSANIFLATTFYPFLWCYVLFELVVSKISIVDNPLYRLGKKLFIKGKKNGN